MIDFKIESELKYLFSIKVSLNYFNNKVPISHLVVNIF